MSEVFDFVSCADPKHQMMFNIESKIDAEHPNNTVGVYEFVTRQHAAFMASPYRYSITFQSFDWRSIVAMKVGFLAAIANLSSLITSCSN